MIIIETNAEHLLTATLDSWRTNPGHGRVILIRRSALPSLQKLSVADIGTMFGQQVKDPEAKAYILSDGDVCITTADVRYEIFQKFIKMLSVLTQETMINHSRLYDGQVDWEALKQLVSSKLEDMALARQEVQQLQSDGQRKAREEERERTRHRIMGMQFDAAFIRTLGERRQRRLRVEALVVEDDKFSQQLVQNALRKHVNVAVADNGEDAIMSYISNPPDIVFLDIDLPDVQGFDVLTKLQSLDPDAFIIMLSGNGDRDNIIRALKHGAKGFVGKPFSPKKLMEYIHKSPWAQKHLQPDHAHMY